MEKSYVCFAHQWLAKSKHHISSQQDRSEGPQLIGDLHSAVIELVFPLTDSFGFNWSIIAFWKYATKYITREIKRLKTKKGRPTDNCVQSKERYNLKGIKSGNEDQCYAIFSQSNDQFLCLLILQRFFYFCPHTSLYKAHVLWELLLSIV